MEGYVFKSLSEDPDTKFAPNTASLRGTLEELQGQAADLRTKEEII